MEAADHPAPGPGDVVLNESREPCSVGVLLSPQLDKRPARVSKYWSFNYFDLRQHDWPPDPPFRHRDCSFLVIFTIESSVVHCASS